MDCNNHGAFAAKKKKLFSLCCDVLKLVNKRKNILKEHPMKEGMGEVVGFKECMCFQS